MDEKTIMLVGATGSGKSTLVDGIVNYVMGVSFDDPFRFTLVQLEEEEKRTHNQVFYFNFWYFRLLFIKGIKGVRIADLFCNFFTTIVRMNLKQTL